MDFRNVTRTARTGLLYGLGAFLIGAVFGTLRELVLIPAFARATGHAIQFPILTAIVAALAGYLVLRAPVRVGTALAWGCLGTLILVAVESTFALTVVGLPLELLAAMLEELAAG